MNANKLLQEVLVSVAIVALVVLVWNPFDILMSGAVVMILLVVLAAVFSLFAVFVWREEARDEREALHRMFAGRVGFLAGAGVLGAAILVEGFSHNVNPWIATALIAMIGGKVCALVWAKLKQ
jgi:drug/metabolite transporter (DMT)-like permease